MPFADGFRSELGSQGRPPCSAKRHLTLMGELNRWLVGEQLEVGALTVVVAQRFLDYRRAVRQGRVCTMASLAPLLDYLRGREVLPVERPVVPTRRDQLLADYREHLVRDRGLTPTTVRRYERFARRFLAQRSARTGTDVGVEGLVVAEVYEFMLEAGSRLVVESAKREAADLRSLLRFLYLSGSLETDLGGAMPPVAVWRGSRLPATMSVTEVDAVLGTCDRSTVSGRRNWAILVLLARLGLRCGEVAALRLADVDWRAGEIVVRGKARRQDRLPLPVEVGEALVDYLTNARPTCGCPQLIVTLHAPHRPIQPSSITGVVYQACRRGGLPRVGGHRLRHALASEMLRQGGSLVEIAQVLRQSDLGTTSGYARVDRVALRSVSQPWPGAAR